MRNIPFFLLCLTALVNNRSCYKEEENLLDYYHYIYDAMLVVFSCKDLSRNLIEKCIVYNITLEMYGISLLFAAGNDTCYQTTAIEICKDVQLT